MVEFDPRNSADFVSDVQAAGRDSTERSDVEQRSTSLGSNEVRPRRSKRRFTAAEKLRILAEADRCTKHGELGALLRREGIYSSQVAKWRELRTQGQLGALSDKKRGRKAELVNPLSTKLADAEKRNRLLEKKLEQAETIIEFQKKFLEIVGKLPKSESEERNS